MSTAAHLGIRLDEYDERIRTFIPPYDEMLDAAAEAVRAATGSRRRAVLVDLGIGSGALSGRAIDGARGVRVVGIDAEPAMLDMARARLGSRLTPLAGDFLTAPLPSCHAVAASLALHHVRTPSAKRRMYRRVHAALKQGGLLVIADCCLASSRRQQQRDRAVWLAHLARTYTRRESTRFLRAWAREDVYFRLEDELRMLRAAGFVVDVPWRQHNFAVIVGEKTPHRALP